MKIAYVMILVLVLGLVAGCGEKAEPKQIEPVIKGGDVVEDTTTVLDEEPVTETVEEDTEEVMEDEEEVVEEDEEETVEEETTVPEKLPEEKIDIKDMEFIP
ncbi:hypothetical protein KY337_00650, partial [Candidatus Woesearchaeota archaeon]|nr:hypothetical protein [Candidatus Woesearchaeota archaeon]